MIEKKRKEKESRNIMTTIEKERVIRGDYKIKVMSANSSAGPDPGRQRD